MNIDMDQLSQAMDMAKTSVDALNGVGSLVQKIKDLLTKKTEPLDQTSKNEHTDHEEAADMPLETPVEESEQHGAEPSAESDEERIERLERDIKQLSEAVITLAQALGQLSDAVGQNGEAIIHVAGACESNSESIRILSER